MLGIRLHQAATGASTAAVTTASTRAFSTSKPVVRIAFQLKNGLGGEVRRPQESDRAALDKFIATTPANPLFQSFSNEFHRSREIDDQLWMAQSPSNDSFIAKVQDRVVGLAGVEPEPDEMERQLDPRFLAEHGLKPSQVCVSRLRVSADFREQGVGTALKRAVAQGAADAGFKAVVSETVDPAVIGIVTRLGGEVESGSVRPWTVLKVPLKEET